MMPRKYAVFITYKVFAYIIRVCSRKYRVESEIFRFRFLLISNENEIASRVNRSVKDRGFRKKEINFSIYFSVRGWCGLSIFDVAYSLYMLLFNHFLII